MKPVIKFKQIKYRSVNFLASRSMKRKQSISLKKIFNSYSEWALFGTAHRLGWRQKGPSP